MVLLKLNVEFKHLAVVINNYKSIILNFFNYSNSGNN